MRSSRSRWDDSTFLTYYLIYRCIDEIVKLHSGQDQLAEHGGRSPGECASRDVNLQYATYNSSECERAVSLIRVTPELQYVV